MSVGVVLLDLNQSETTVRCLESLAAGTVCPSTVVLVENGDRYVSREELDELRQTLDIVVLRPTENLGCAGGRNLGLNYLAANTGVSTCMILDNDTVVPESFIATIEETPFDDHEVVAPVIENLNDETVWSSGGAVEPDGTIDQFTCAPDADAEPFSVDWSPGACLIMRKDTWEEVGEFDRWMNFLFEDIEWCLRVAEVGGDVVVHPNLVLQHEAHQTLGGKISPARTRYWARNGTVFRLDTLGTDRSVTFEWLSRQLTLALREFATGRLSYSRARFRGVVEGLTESVRRW